MNRIAIIAAAAISASFMAAVPAAAENLSVQVFYGDLDTSSQAGAEALAQRVKKSVNLACERPDMRNLRAGGEWQECREAALTQVTEQLAQQGLVLAPTITAG
jgi:UrcA family protein